MPASRNERTCCGSTLPVIAMIGNILERIRQGADASRRGDAVHHRHLNIHQHNVVATDLYQADGVDAFATDSTYNCCL